VCCTTLRLEQVMCSGALFTRDGKAAYVASTDGILRKCDVTSDKVCPCYVCGCALHVQGHRRNLPLTWLPVASDTGHSGAYTSVEERDYEHEQVP